MVLGEQLDYHKIRELVGEPGDGGLLLRLPRNEILLKESTITRDRTTSYWAASPMRITEALCVKKK